MYRYLLWDIDNTILDFLAAEEYAIRFLFRKYRIGECTDEMLAVYSKINRRYWEALERNEMTKPQILVGRFREFFETMGIDPSIAEAFNADYQVTLGDNCVFMPYAREMLLQEKGKYRLIAVTNGTKVAQQKKLRVSGLDKIFDEVYISEDVGAEKPNREYFDFVFREAGITDPKEVLVIGDSLTSDMRGGELSGADTCWFNPGHAVNDKGVKVTYEIDSLERLEDILKA